MRKVDSPLCSLCGNANETVVHLFSECNKTIGLWSEIQAWTNTVIKLPDLNKRNIILGIYENTNPSLHLINHVILLYKRFIYTKRDKPYTINVDAFKRYIAYIQKIEQQIANSKNKTEKHFNKWNPFICLQ